MFVSASTDCFPQLSLEAALAKLLDLEYTRVEIALCNRKGQLAPSEVAADLDAAIRRCRDVHRLTPVAYDVELDPNDKTQFQQFGACCKLAKATKVVMLAVSAAETGTPFNAEIERLKEFVKLAAGEGVVVCVKTETGRMTEDPRTALALVKNVKGLGVALDPSHFICGPCAGADYDALLPYTCHLRLRDTSKDKLQVRVGQGTVEYGKLVNSLGRFDYRRALAVHIVDEPTSGIDHDTEMRKMRLLLESLV
ncbi:MAG TPA: sugar phosphate isomerase/epimerase [Pirellulales bacterium]